MTNDREKWIEDVMGSLQGSSRAQPPSDLFEKIERQLPQSETKVIPMYRMKIAVAAAALLLILNGVAISYHVKQEVSSSVEISTSQPLISTYNLYEQ